MKRVLGLMLIAVLLTPIPGVAIELSALDDPGLQALIKMGEYQSSIGVFRGATGEWRDLDTGNITREVVLGNGSHALVFNDSGSLVRQISNVGTRYPISGDFDRDGHIDDVYDNQDSTADGTAYNSSGFEITDFLDDPIHYANYSSSNYMYAVGDLNHDGYADDIVEMRKNGSYHPYICCYSYMNHTQTHWNFSLGYTFPINLALGGMLIGDFDGDGYRDDVVCLTWMNWTYAFNETGGILWAQPRGGTASAYPSQPVLALGDFNHNGKLGEVAFVSEEAQQVVVLDEIGLKRWDFPIDYGTSFLTVGDLDHNGFLDNVVFGAGLNGTCKLLRALDWLGSELWNYTFPSRIYWAAIGDLDGNGFQDNVVATTASQYTVFNSEGKVIARSESPGFPQFFGNFDGDNASDLLSATLGIELYRLGLPDIQLEILPSVFDEHDDQWRAIGDELPEALYSFKVNASSQEAFPLLVRFNLTSPTQASSTFKSVSSGNSTIHLSVCLQLTPGTYNVTLTASYEGATFCEIHVQVTVVERTIGNRSCSAGSCWRLPSPSI